ARTRHRRCGRQDTGRAETPAAGPGRAEPGGEDRQALRDPGLHLALLVPDRGPVRVPVRPQPGPVGARVTALPGGRRFRGAPVRVRARPRAEPLTGGPGVWPAGAPDPSLPARG